MLDKDVALKLLKEFVLLKSKMEPRFLMEFNYAGLDAIYNTFCHKFIDSEGNDWYVTKSGNYFVDWNGYFGVNKAAYNKQGDSVHPWPILDSTY